MDTARREGISRGVAASIEARRRAGTYSPPPRLIRAGVVELIIRERRRGRSLRGIARALTIYGESTPRGRRVSAHSTVRKVLVHEGLR